jgi:hypothetical protein
MTWTLAPRISQLRRLTGCGPGATEQRSARLAMAASVDNMPCRFRAAASMRARVTAHREGQVGPKSLGSEEPWQRSCVLVRARSRIRIWNAGTRFSWGGRRSCGQHGSRSRPSAGPVGSLRPAWFELACRHARRVRRCILVRSVDVADRARVPLCTSVLQLPGSGAVRRVTGDVGLDYSDAWTRRDDPPWANRRRFPKFGPRPRAGTNLVRIWSELR